MNQRTGRSLNVLHVEKVHKKTLRNIVQNLV